MKYYSLEKCCDCPAHKWTLLSETTRVCEMAGRRFEYSDEFPAFCPLPDACLNQYEDEFELFLDAQENAKEQLEIAQSEKDRVYWQGVKDGLRNCYAIFANAPEWVAVSGNSPQGRPNQQVVDRANRQDGR